MGRRRLGTITTPVRSNLLRIASGCGRRTDPMNFRHKRPAQGRGTTAAAGRRGRGHGAAVTQLPPHRRVSAKQNRPARRAPCGGRCFVPHSPAETPEGVIPTAIQDLVHLGPAAAFQPCSCRRSRRSQGRAHRRLAEHLCSLVHRVDLAPGAGLLSETSNRAGAVSRTSATCDLHGAILLIGGVHPEDLGRTGTYAPGVSFFGSAAADHEQPRVLRLHLA